jgi:hypothetical protein
MGVEPCTPLMSEPPVDAGWKLPLRLGTVPGVNEPPANGLVFGEMLVAMSLDTRVEDRGPRKQPSRFQRRRARGRGGGTRKRRRVSFRLF